MRHDFPINSHTNPDSFHGDSCDHDYVWCGHDASGIDAMRIHYNFIRGNQAIDGQTPAQAAGINLNLGENKTESLMRQAAIHAKDELVSPLVKGLGVRIHKVTILNEKDCIKIKQKGWLDKKDWVEIHDILRVQGFAWLSNGKDSCWIKMF